MQFFKKCFLLCQCLALLLALSACNKSNGGSKASSSSVGSSVGPSAELGEKLVYITIPVQGASATNLKFKDFYGAFQSDTIQWYQEDEFWIMESNVKDKRTHEINKVLVYFGPDSSVQGNILVSRIVANRKNMSTNEIYQVMMYYATAVEAYVKKKK